VSGAGDGAIGRRPPHPASRGFAIAATVAMWLPLVPPACLYGQWIISWVVLGHRPLPSIDDPKFIDGDSWMHLVTGVSFIGFAPALLAAIVLNVWYVASSRLDSGPVARRMLALSAVTGGTIAWLVWDPFRVAYWWID